MQASAKSLVSTPWSTPQIWMRSLARTEYTKKFHEVSICFRFVSGVFTWRVGWLTHHVMSSHAESCRVPGCQALEAKRPLSFVWNPGHSDLVTSWWRSCQALSSMEFMQGQLDMTRLWTQLAFVEMKNPGFLSDLSRTLPGLSIGVGHRYLWQDQSGAPGVRRDLQTFRTVPVSRARNSNNLLFEVLKSMSQYEVQNISTCTCMPPQHP